MGRDGTARGHSGHEKNPAFRAVRLQGAPHHLFENRAVARGSWQHVEVHSDPPLRDSWFKQRAQAVPSDPPPASDPPPPKPEGSLGWAIGLGGLGGGVGGGAMLVIAGELAQRMRTNMDVVRTVGNTVRVLADPFLAGIVVGVVLGAVSGAAIGALMRHSMRFTARVLAGVILAPVLWTLVHAFVLKSFAPNLGALPFGPMAAGAVAYGLCIALLRPPQKLPGLVEIDD
jgi:hypothetical protein